MRYFVVIRAGNGDGATLYRQLETQTELQPALELVLDGQRIRVETVGPGVAGADATLVCARVERLDAIAGPVAR